MVDYGVAPAGARLPDALSLGVIRLQVTNLERSVDFYGGLLGMSVLSGGGSAVLLGASDGEPLLELVQGGAAHARRRGRLGLYHFAVLLPDRAALGRILSHLVQNGAAPGAADHLVSEALYLQDPDDLGIEIYRDRPRSDWTVEGRQLAMSSDPLDARGIVDAAEGAEWTGMPAGTRIGHVHLHVGDLDTARAFYHEALGFDLTVWSYPGALFMSAGGYHHHLGVNTWAGAHATAPEPAEPRLLDWEIILPAAQDVAAIVDRIDRHGYTVSAVEDNAGTASDPWGTQVRLRSR